MVKRFIVTAFGGLPLERLVERQPALVSLTHSF
jgi:hypothetical protein